MNLWNKISKWEQYRHQKHPLLSQIATKIISALLVAVILWGFARAKALVTGDRINQTEGRLTITNRGLLPLNVKYSVVTEDASLILPKGQTHVTVYPGIAENIKILEVNSLPGASSAIVEVQGSGSAQVKDVSGNTVILYPAETKKQ